MGLFNIFKKRTQSFTQESSIADFDLGYSCLELPQNIALELWEYSEGISISFQHVSGPGIHIICEVKYIPKNRIVICKTSSTSPSVRYEGIIIPPRIRNAEELINYVEENGGSPWFVYGYKLSEELEQKLNSIL